MKTVKTSIGTVRRNTVKARLILFSVLAIALIACSFFSEYLTPYDPYLQNLDIAKQAPTKAHPLGTDRYGRDMLSRVIAGSRASIFSTLLLVAIITTLGTAVGVTCGWVGGLKETQYKTLMAEASDKAMTYAVKGMVPSNTLGAKAMTRLHCYKAADHAHAAQKPEAVEI